MKRHFTITVAVFCLSVCFFRPAILASQDSLVDEVNAPALAAVPRIVATFVPPAPCSAPFTTGLAFDSIHNTMWVAVTPASGPGFVCEFALTPPYTLMATVPNVINPYALVFDPATGYVWATNVYSAPGVFVNTVTVINTPGAGALVNILPTGSHPAGDCLFAGEVWVMNFGPPAGPWTFDSFLDRAPWTAAAYAAAGNNPHSCVAVGADLWFTLEFSNAVEKVAPPAPGVTFPVGVQPWGIAFDGTSVWVANQISNTVQALSPATGASRAILPLPAPANSPFDLIFGVAAGIPYLWAVDEVSGTLTQIMVLPAAPWGAVTGTSAAFGVAPQFAAFDPVNNHIWVTSTTSGTITILN
jgi:DNA-binding beta-propeller fold protein YncE